MSDKHKYFEPRMHKQALQAECCRLHDQRDQLREALEWLLYEGSQTSESEYIANRVKARAALKETEEG